MPAARYTFLPLSDDTCLLSSEFELYECGNLLVKFARRSVREKLESFGRGNNWIGSILRLLEKKYPFRITLLFSGGAIVTPPESLWLWTTLKKWGLLND